MKYNNLSHTEVGIYGENAACNFLIHRSYRIIHRNFHIGKIGEIDIIAEKTKWFRPFLKRNIVFVEVKTLAQQEKSLYIPESHVNDQKKERLIRLAMLYLSCNRIKMDTPWQIDVIAVEIDSFTGNIQEIRHHENAVHL